MDPPFYVLSSGDETPDYGSSSNTSQSSSLHDTFRARFHIQDVEAFAADVNSAAKSAFPNRGRSRYKSVNACLIRWDEDELQVQCELGRLNHKFQDYGFSTNVWHIPSRDSHLEFMSKAIDLIRASDNDQNLFIIYYAGHGRINDARQAEWTCRGRDPNYASVDWSAIQSLFAKARSDVLILLDTCAAASSTMRSQYGVMEAIVACGFESKAPPPGEHSFTNTLIEVLDDWIRKPSFSASCLHTEILFQLKLKETRKGREGIKLEWCVTPIHINYTQDSKALGIELSRRKTLALPISAGQEQRLSTFVDAMEIDTEDSNTQPTQVSSLTTSGDFQIPHVLIKVGLEHNQPPMDSDQFVRWLGRIPLLAKWAKIEGVYPSYSTLMILSVPVPVWSMLPDHPACSFIGYVTAPNLITQIPSKNDSVDALATPSKLTPMDMSSNILQATAQESALVRISSNAFHPKSVASMSPIEGYSNDLPRPTDNNGRDKRHESSTDKNADAVTKGPLIAPKPRKIACVICRKRKLKCDGSKPSCTTCARLGHKCVYDEVHKNSGPKRGYVKALRERLKQIETSLEHPMTVSALVTQDQDGSQCNSDEDTDQDLTLSTSHRNRSVPARNSKMIYGQTRDTGSIKAITEIINVLALVVLLVVFIASLFSLTLAVWTRILLDPLLTSFEIASLLRIYYLKVAMLFILAVACWVCVNLWRFTRKQEWRDRFQSDMSIKQGVHTWYFTRWILRRCLTYSAQFFAASFGVSILLAPVFVAVLIPITHTTFITGTSVSLFGVWISRTTDAETHEILLATAAYAAVLVSFLGNIHATNTPNHGDPL